MVITFSPIFMLVLLCRSAIVYPAKNKNSKYNNQVSFIHNKICLLLKKIKTPQIKNLRKEFTKLDVHQSGEISYDDLKMVLKSSGTFKDEELDNIFINARRGWEHTGNINYHEFIAATISITAIKDENLKLAFEMMSNRNGYITAADIQDLLGKDATFAEVEKMLLEIGLSPSTQISYADVIL